MLNGHKTTKIKFFYNTPLLDYNNTIHFTSNSERDKFFWNDNVYNSYDDELVNYNFIKDKQSVNANIPYELTNGMNYMSFYSEFDNVYYYAYIMEANYINIETTEIKFVIDVIMTYTQGKTLSNLKNVNIQRQHLPRTEYMNYLQQIRNNNDVLKCSTKQYVYNKFFDFGENYVIFESTVDLSQDFGTIEDPRINSASGTLYDNISGATKIYVIAYDEFQNFLTKMSEYPWITQNFSKIKMIPKIFIDENDLELVGIPSINYGLVRTLKYNSNSSSPDLTDLNLNFIQLRDIVSHETNTPKYNHLVRNEYMTIELYDLQGNSLFIDAGQLQTDVGLELLSKSIIGFDNNIKIYPKNYQSADDESGLSKFNGTFLTQSLTINTFTELPIMINTGQLSKANTANQRNLQESFLLTNQAKSLIDNSSSTEQKLYNAISIGSNLSPASIMSKADDEYKTYERQKADFKDMALKPPTLTSSEMGNAFLIANNINGILLKISAPNEIEINNIKNYYNSFGFELEFTSNQPFDIESMTIMNYLRCSGNYLIKDMPIYLYNQLQANLEMGVKFWHNNGTANPFTQDINENDFK